MKGFAILASRGRIVADTRNNKGGVWIQRTEARMDRTNALTSVEKDNMVLEYEELALR